MFAASGSHLIGPIEVLLYRTGDGGATWEPADLDLGAVPLRQAGMEPFEILTSESQERMLAVVRPDRLDAVTAVCERWGLPPAVIGRVTSGGLVRARLDGGSRIVSNRSRRRS